MDGRSGTLEGILDDLRDREPVRYVFVVQIGDGEVLAASGQTSQADVRRLGGGRPPGHPLPRDRDASGRTRFVEVDHDHILGVVADPELPDERVEPAVRAVRRVLAGEVA